MFHQLEINEIARAAEQRDLCQAMWEEQRQQITRLEEFISHHAMGKIEGSIWLTDDDVRHIKATARRLHEDGVRGVLWKAAAPCMEVPHV